MIHCCLAVYMEIADTEAYRTILEIEIRKHASRMVELRIVEDIAQWETSRGGNPRRNPSAMAITEGPSSDWVILLRRSISRNSVASILDRVEFGGFPEARSLLTSPETFLRHTVLHELAHLENPWGQDREEACDEWAFAKLDTSRG